MKKPIIICIDDEATVLSSLKRELKATLGNGVELETALGGMDALELLEELIAEGSEIAVVIADYIMPDLKGDEVLQRFHVASPDTVKIMLTGQATIEGVTNAINSAKLYRYIAKPWQIEDLSLTVKEALKSYFQQQQLAEQNAQLRANERRLTQFLEAMPVGVAVHDVTGQLTYANCKAKELLGIKNIPNTITNYPATDYQVYRSGIGELYPENELPVPRSLAGETIHTDDIEIHQSDAIIPLEVYARPIYDEKGKIISSIATFQDITERKQAEAEREQFTQYLSQLNESFSHFVPRQFLQCLQKNSIIDINLGDNVEREMSILFSDIRSFTTLSEQMTPEDNFKFINGYLSRMEPPIIENNGFIDKYIGDAIMALFDSSADDAVKAGIKMLKILAEYNHSRQQFQRLPLKIGIGINTGNLMLGTIGGKSRMDSTVISDAVNLASRLESLTKIYGVSLLISHHTLTKIQDPMNYAMRLIDQVQVKGKLENVSVFEVFDADSLELFENKLATKTMFENALSHYYQGQIEEASQLFQKCLEINPGDSVVQIYLQRCQSQSSIGFIPKFNGGK
jgi:class 3 adenylate cyclase/PAS domain-containing protein